MAEETLKTARADDASASSRPLPDAETSLTLLETMALIRRFEEEAGRQYQRAKAGGFLHLAIGEEATIVGTTAAMEPEDYLIGTYRTHGHAIARGTEPKHVMAELFGRVDGTSGGRGGSMHVFDGERRFMGGYGIVGGNLPLAAGLALASDYKGTDEVTVCMFGDGASNTGNFGETMNLAALWRLPIVFILENNLYGMGTSVERHSAVTDFSKKAEGLGVPGVRADGMDVLAMRETVAEHIRIAREERKPTMVEAFTYRYRGHSAADPEVYRTKEEVAEWRKKDPIEIFADRLEEEGVLNADAPRADARTDRGAGARGGRVRRRISRAAPGHALRPPLRGRRPGARLVRGRRARADSVRRRARARRARGRGEAARRGRRRLRRPGRLVGGARARADDARTARRPTRSRTARSSSPRTTRAKLRGPGELWRQ